MKLSHKIVLGVFCALLLSAVWAAAHRDSTPALTDTLPPAGVSGSLHNGCFLSCGNDDAAKALKASDIWCAWRDGHVKVHLTLDNTLNAVVTVRITPKYEIENGGTHGNSFGSDLPVKLAALTWQEAVLDAGVPKGVAPGVPISKCEPQLEGADIG